MGSYIAVFIGGGLGSISRFGLSRLITSGFQSVNPTATLLANLLATFLLGAMVVIGGEKLMQIPFLKGLLITGFCGGFSTFSTFSYETFVLLREGYSLMAFANVLLSLALAVIILYMLAQAPAYEQT